MCAGGVPVPNNTNPIDAVRAGLAMQEFIEERKRERIQAGQVPFELRVGIHTGAVVAGVVGRKKFAYDIWGDAVNIAARMESSGETGRVNISETTYELVKNEFYCNYRGKIQAKNKGEIDMYFVNGPLR
jgi:class 3 adenylate cyclase